MKEACNPASDADVAAVMVGPGTAVVCLITEHLTIDRGRVNVNVPKKRSGSSAHTVRAAPLPVVDFGVCRIIRCCCCCCCCCLQQKAMSKFYEQVYQTMLRAVDLDVVKVLCTVPCCGVPLPPSHRWTVWAQVVIIAGPGFHKDDFHTYMNEEAVRRGDKAVLKNKCALLGVWLWAQTQRSSPLTACFRCAAKFLLIHASSADKRAIREVLSNPVRLPVCLCVCVWLCISVLCVSTPVCVSLHLCLCVFVSAGFFPSEPSPLHHAGPCVVVQGVASQLADTKAAKETAVMNQFFKMLNSASDRATYGFNHVKKAADLGAVSTLMVCARIALLSPRVCSCR